MSAAGTNLASDILGLGATSAGTYYTRDNAGGLVGERVSGANYYFLLDGLGSVVKIIDSTGAVVRTYSYDAWGKTTVGSGTVHSDFRYAGGYYDVAGGLYKFGTRYYDPSIGRWTQQDPVAGTLGDPRTSNRYIYAGNDPVNFVDLHGTFPVAAVVAGVVIAGLVAPFVVGVAAGIKCERNKDPRACRLLRRNYPYLDPKVSDDTGGPWPWRTGPGFPPVRGR
ncbi:MAG: hypothetical protein M3Q48_17760 [Actinomycetota bacterium]|nr:hypothetical protein [Actinomycetota bacterium]